ncbi:MAG: aminotransferase class IV [Candidatus Omnitrophica bacterium]|nr:aminotransferase class IV [Candidatus Omnitrophota bacterium]
MNTQVYQNGKRIQGDFDTAQLHDHTQGIFETFRVYHGKVFREAQHLERLVETARTAGYAEKIDLKEIRRQVRRAILKSAYRDAVIRINLIAGEIFVMIGVRRAPEQCYLEGIKLQTSPVKRIMSNASFPEAKTTAYQNAVLATLEPRGEGVFEWLFLDKNGYVTEVRTGNLFIVTEGGPAIRTQPVLWTPPLQGILNGVTRQFVIECALRAGMVICENIMTRHDIFKAREAFLTNTSWEILPVRMLDGRLIGDQVPGIYTTRLHQLFKKRVHAECQPTK